MITKSIIGKLWATVVGFFTTVLLLLSILLIEYIDNRYFHEQTKSLQMLSEKITVVMNKYQYSSQFYDAIESILPIYNVEVLVYTKTEGIQYKSPSLKNKSFEELMSNIDIKKIIETNKSQAIRRKAFPDTTLSVAKEMLVYAYPYKLNNNDGLIILYQSLSFLDNTAKDIKNAIIITLIITIILSVLLFLFLATKITKPLRNLRISANEIAAGNFNQELIVDSYDEIGELSLAFNKMRIKIQESFISLNQEKEQLAGILKSIKDVVFTTDNNGKIILMNRHAEFWFRTLIYNGSDEENNYFIPKELNILFQYVIENKKDIYDEILINDRFFFCAMSPLKYNNKLRGVVTVIRDITTEKEIDKLRKDILANISHELRTPVSLIQGYSEAILDDMVRSDEEKNELLQIIHDEALRMVKLVNQLLDLARMEAGFSELQYVEVDFIQIIDKIEKKFRKKLNEIGIDFIVDSLDKSFNMQIDPNRIEQVLINLIENAIRFTPKGGHIIIRFRHNENRVFISVIDNGSGIKSEDIPFIFERFYKSDKSRKRGGYGTGLGLAICKKIVESHGGSINVRSLIGKGSTFTFCLPINKEENRCNYM